MASTRSMSPGGALLRSSRMFSLPAPLPTPITDNTYESSSATKAYPTLQAISTSPAARKRGDWGLKRSFPLKMTTKSARPSISVKQIDSPEHITDYQFASNFNLALHRFQELNLPITVPKTSRNTTLAIGRSPFEENMDIGSTDLATMAPGARDNRWKFQGPTLGKMTPREYTTWLQSKVKPRRAEFRQFLRQKMAAKLTEAKKAESADADGLSMETVEPVDPKDVTKEYANDYIRSLYADKQVLNDMVSEFLDLPPSQPPNIAESISSLLNHRPINLKVSDSPYAKDGPPMGHPSGGLSYLRTGAVLENHPVYGPQANRAPVEARIVAPRAASSMAQPAVGLAGFLAHINGDSELSSRDTKDENLRRYNPALEGGAKTYVQATRAHFDADGKLILSVKQADKKDECIAKELIGEDKVFGVAQEPRTLSRPSTSANFGYNRFTKSSMRVNKQ